MLTKWHFPARALLVIAVLATKMSFTSPEKPAHCFRYPSLCPVIENAAFPAASLRKNPFRAVSLVVSRWRCGALVLREKRKTRDLKMSYGKIFRAKWPTLREYSTSENGVVQILNSSQQELRNKWAGFECALHGFGSSWRAAALPAGRGGARGNFVPAHRRNPEEKSQITVTSKGEGCSELHRP